MRTAGLVLIWTIVAPLILLPRAAAQAKAWENHPIVPDAAIPPLRFDRPQTRRRCGKCGGTAELVDIMRHNTNGMPAGTERQYQCPQCGNTFITESTSGIVSNMIGALLFGVGGLVTLIDPEGRNTPAEKYLLLPMALCAGAWFAWSAVKAIASNRRNRPA